MRTPRPRLSTPQVLPTQLVPDDEGKILRVRLIQKEGKVGQTGVGRLSGREPCNPSALCRSPV